MTVQKPEIVITYCTQCQWLLRAAWLAQELLSTFGDDLGKVSLVPGTGGVFHIFCNEVQIWERKADGGFPEARCSSSGSGIRSTRTATSGTTIALSERRLRRPRLFCWRCLTVDWTPRSPR